MRVLALIAVIGGAYHLSPNPRIVVLGVACLGALVFHARQRWLSEREHP